MCLIERHPLPQVVRLRKLQGFIDATANATRQAARANRTYQTIRQLHRPTARP